jgi:hypothetical protein
MKRSPANSCNLHASSISAFQKGFAGVSANTPIRYIKDFRHYVSETTHQGIFPEQTFPERKRHAKRVGLIVAGGVGKTSRAPEMSRAPEKGSSMPIDWD